MFKLCRRDAAASWPFWLLLLLIFILVGFNPLKPALIFFLMGPALVFGWAVTSLALEERFKTQILFSSLPLRRSQLVQARYLLAGILTLAGVLISSLMIHFLAFWRLLEKKAVARLLRPEGVMAFVVLVAFLFSLFLPMVFRLGLQKALYAFLISLLALAAIGSAITEIALRLSPGKHSFHLLSPLVAFYRQSGPLLFLSLGAGLVALLVIFSMRCSIRFYQKRDL